MTTARKTSLAYLALALIWGTTWHAIRVTIGPDGFPTMLAAALRFTLAAAILVPLAWTARPWPRKAQWPWLVVAGVLNAVGYALIYLGERDVPGGLAAVLSGTQPLVIAALLLLTRMETVRPSDVIGALIALAGVAIIFADQLAVSTGQAVGVLLVIGSVIVSVLYTVVIKRHGGRIHPLASTTVFVVVTAACLWIATLASGHQGMPWPLPHKATMALVYLAVAGTAVGFAAYFWLLERVSLLAANVLGFVIPVIALAVDALFEAEVQLGPRAYLGVAVILAAVMVAQRRPAPTPAA
ncbi:MAG: EamA family transporter [Myxococcales bacterium]|nr:EamA family transporter [Myxococcales bacterium]